MKNGLNINKPLPLIPEQKLKRVKRVKKITVYKRPRLDSIYSINDQESNPLCHNKNNLNKFFEDSSDSEISNIGYENILKIIELYLLL